MVQVVAIAIFMVHLQPLWIALVATLEAMAAVIVLWIAAVCQRTVTTSTVILAIIVAVTYADLAAVMAVVGQVTVGGEVVVQWRISC